MYNIERIWPEWKAVRLIGEGSSGKVYEIVRSKMGIEEHSALKVISVPQSKSEVNVLLSEGMDEHSTADYYNSIVQSYVSEISLMSKLKGHPNIVTYEDYQVVKHSDGIGYDILIRMELLTPLSEIIRQNRFDTDDIVDFAVQLCDALSVCHKNNILHRDIKYDNIFVSRLGGYKLGDFGVARKFDKTSGNFSLKGTYTYMAPEIYKGQAYGVSSDIYSFGIVLYRLMNKNREAFVPMPPSPIRLSDKESALAKRMCGEQMPAPVDASAELAQIILRACAFNQSDRYNTVDELKLDLLNYKNSSVLDKRSDNSSVVSDVDDDKTVSVFDDSDAQHIVYMSEDDKTNSIDDCDKTVAVFDHVDNSSELENKTRDIQSKSKDNNDKDTHKSVDKKPKKRKFVLIGVIVAVLLLVFILGIVKNLVGNIEDKKTPKDYYNEGTELLEEYADSLDDNTMKAAAECFKKAGDYKKAKDYLAIAESCLWDTEFRAMRLMRDYAQDECINAILESPKYLDDFLSCSKWISGSYSIDDNLYCLCGENFNGPYIFNSDTGEFFYRDNAEYTFSVEILDCNRIEVTHNKRGYVGEFTVDTQ